jgi:hypothetical protein
LALRRARRVRLPARQGRRERAMASRQERPVTPRHQERPVMWPDLEVAARHQGRPVMWPDPEVAAGPGSLPHLGAAAAEFEQPHEM